MWSFLFHYILAVHRQIRLGQKGKNEKCWKSSATEGSVCAIQSDYYRGEKLFDRWVERRGGDEKPQEQEKRMTSPFCHSCELAPLCFMEIGIDEDTRVTKNREHVRACRINKSWSQIDKNAPPPRLNSTDLSVLRMLCRTHSPALCSLLWSLNLFATWRGVNLSEATTAQNLLLTTVGLILALMEKLLFSYGEPKQRSFSNWRTCTMLDMRQQLLLNGESK